MGTVEKNVFDLLAKPVRKALEASGFLSPTLPQTMTFRPILEGRNVLLIAPTGTGKTEAVLLPIFSQLVQERHLPGIAAIYVTPLRALNRDLFKRLSFWSRELDISIDVRHGDTETKLRRRQAVSPPSILVTTPETLQAILPGSRMRKHLESVRFVVVDEVHELASSKRGIQLAVGLERLREVSKTEFQRIGLSATVGNPDQVAKFLAGTDRPIEIVEAPLLKDCQYHVESPVPMDTDYDLASRLNTSPEAAARLRRIAELVDSHKSILIFVNSRTVAEMLGYRLSQLGRTDTAVHHGSLSREERTQVEDDFKMGKLKAIVCTSTLELGIDIGTIDLVIQYLSPRQVNSLVQRVGRSGHRLDMLSEGVILTAYPDDTLESVAAVVGAEQKRLEPVTIHEMALDVLSHQVAGFLMDMDSVRFEKLFTIVKRAYPYRMLDEDNLRDLISFLDRLGELRLDQDETLRKTRKTRIYYYENLSMIPDERRYPVISLISDRKIGSLGDEFMALKARIGLNIIMRGKVWRIVQIEEETGTVYVIPSEDPTAAIPGWDGEMLPIPYELAQETGKLRERIGALLKETRNADTVMERLAQELSAQKSTFTEVVAEVEEHLKLGAPLPTNNRVLVEAFDNYLIVHASFGDAVNRTLGSIFDSLLSDREVIVGWWNDGYRILIEMPRKLARHEVEKLSEAMFHLSDGEVDEAFEDYLDAKFPFSYKMRFVAERFGALPRGKTMSYERLSQLPARFSETPIYDETVREAMLEKVDLKTAKEIFGKVRTGEIAVNVFLSVEKPTPLAYHMLAGYSDMSELMAPARVLLSNVDRMKRTIEARTAKLLCMASGDWWTEKKVQALEEKPVCDKCGSGLLALLYPSQDVNGLAALLKKRRDAGEMSEEELKELSRARRTADLVLSYGKKAVVALEVKGVGPETASRILGKMHAREDEFYMDLLRAKIQYLKNRQYWDTKEDRAARFSR